MSDHEVTVHLTAVRVRNEEADKESIERLEQGEEISAYTAWRRAKERTQRDGEKREADAEHTRKCRKQDEQSSQ